MMLLVLEAAVLAQRNFQEREKAVGDAQQVLDAVVQHAGGGGRCFDGAEERVDNPAHFP